MAKKAGMFFVIAGTALIISALSLFLCNRYEDAKAGRSAEKVLGSLIQLTEERSEQLKESSGQTEQPETDMPVVEIEGNGYVGYISIPALDIELPVMSEWDYERLAIAPCRQFGSSRTDDLVIAAHNYRSHFGSLEELTAGDSVAFIDMDGIVNDYIVAETSVLQPTEVDAVQNSKYDLVLYTCTSSGSTRFVVFCERQGNRGGA